eukprot:gene8525-10501_t
MARAPKGIQPMLLMLVILPFWTSFLIRVYAWIGILSPEGFLNQGLQALGLIDEPLLILNTDLAVYIGIVYSYLPFMVLPLYSALEKLDGTLLEAASDLGCPPWKAFWKITFPLSLPGVVAGSMICFIPITGEFVIPDLLGGPHQAEVVERLLGLGAHHLDIGHLDTGQGDVPWVVLVDPEGNPFCVMEDRAAYDGTGPIAALPLHSADPDRDADFWAWLTGWTHVPGVDARS